MERREVYRRQNRRQLVWHQDGLNDRLGQDGLNDRLGQDGLNDRLGQDGQA